MRRSIYFVVPFLVLLNSYPVFGDDKKEDLSEYEDIETLLQRLLDEGSLSDCDYCPRKSECIKTAFRIEGWHTRDGFSYQCVCKDGYDGDGWRCEGIDECKEDPWPCPPVETGGYCVDRDPDDAEYPKYKCGCSDGFESWLNDTEHGALICIPEGTADTYVDDPSTQPSVSVQPSSSFPPSPSPSFFQCNLCPPAKSFCVESDADDSQAFLSEMDGNQYIRCECKDGYEGDGWRCEEVNECLLENPPCPTEGGFCVDRSPADGKYKCGCQVGYVAHSSDEHGATSCTDISSAPSTSASPSASHRPSTSFKPTTSHQPSISSSPTQKTELYNSIFLSVDSSVGGSQILTEKDLIELIFRQTYDELDLDEVDRILENVEMLGILSDDGFTSATDEFSSTTGRRILEETFGRRILEDTTTNTNTTDDTTNNTTDTTTTFTFNLSIWFRLTFSCFGCDQNFVFLNDAFRRRLSKLEEESNTDDDVDDGAAESRLLLKSFNDNLNDSLNKKVKEVFVEIFTEKVKKNNLKTIESASKVENEVPQEFAAFVPPTKAPTPFPTYAKTTGDYYYNNYFSSNSPSPTSSYDNSFGKPWGWSSKSPSPTTSYYSYPDYPSDYEGSGGYERSPAPTSAVYYGSSYGSSRSPSPTPYNYYYSGGGGYPSYYPFSYPTYNTPPPGNSPTTTTGGGSYPTTYNPYPTAYNPYSPTYNPYPTAYNPYSPTYNPYPTAYNPYSPTYNPYPTTTGGGGGGSVPSTTTEESSPPIFAPTPLYYNYS